MIVSFVVYSLVVGAFAATAARLLEVTLAGFGRARRGVWIAAIVATVVLPPAATLLQEPMPPLTAPRIASAPRTSVAVQVGRSLQTAPTFLDARIANRALDEGVTIGWLLASGAFVTFHVIGAWRLRRRARHWQPANLGAHAISVSRDIGPAIYGWWRPRVVFPAWLLSAPAATQRLALAHEREHLTVRDPQVLAVATLLTALLPWNAPLLWMLRRLRFAMEVDCDARVVRAGADPSDYGLALLFVSERQARAPIATMALIERPSQLERRINIMVSSPRRRALVAGTCIALAGSCVLAATQIEAPSRVDETPLKPAPGGSTALRLGQRFESLLQERYVGILDEDAAGTNIVVVLMNADGSPGKSARVSSPEKIQNVKPDESMFEAVGVKHDEVAYVGAMGMQSPKDPQHVVLMVYTEKKTPGERFVSKVFPDTRAIDRALFERHFSGATFPAEYWPWILFDRDGAVLRSGRESIDTKDFNAAIEARFPGIRTEAVTVTSLIAEGGGPMYDQAGKELQLISTWLAPGSPPPKD